jgi:hypothetical protein
MTKKITGMTKKITGMIERGAGMTEGIRTSALRISMFCAHNAGKNWGIPGIGYIIKNL